MDRHLKRAAILGLVCTAVCVGSQILRADEQLLPAVKSPLADELPLGIPCHVHSICAGTHETQFGKILKVTAEWIVLEPQFERAQPQPAEINEIWIPRVSIQKVQLHRPQSTYVPTASRVPAVSQNGSVPSGWRKPVFPWDVSPRLTLSSPTAKSLEAQVKQLATIEAAQRLTDQHKYQLLRSRLFGEPPEHQSSLPPYHHLIAPNIQSPKPDNVDFIKVVKKSSPEEIEVQRRLWQRAKARGEIEILHLPHVPSKLTVAAGPVPEVHVPLRIVPSDGPTKQIVRQPSPELVEFYKRVLKQRELEKAHLPPPICESPSKKPAKIVQARYESATNDATAPTGHREPNWLETAVSLIEPSPRKLWHIRTFPAGNEAIPDAIIQAVRSAGYEIVVCDEIQYFPHGPEFKLSKEPVEEIETQKCRPSGYQPASVPATPDESKDSTSKTIKLPRMVKIHSPSSDSPFLNQDPDYEIIRHMEAMEEERAREALNSSKQEESVLQRTNRSIRRRITEPADITPYFPHDDVQVFPGGPEYLLNPIAAVAPAHRVRRVKAAVEQSTKTSVASNASPILFIPYSGHPGEKRQFILDDTNHYMCVYLRPSLSDGRFTQVRGRTSYVGLLAKIEDQRICLRVTSAESRSSTCVKFLSDLPFLSQVPFVSQYFRQNTGVAVQQMNDKEIWIERNEIDFIEIAN